MMRVSDRLVAPSRGSLDQALLYAARFFAPNGNAFVRDYLTEVYRLAPLLSLDASCLVAQSVHETFDDGKPFNSYWFRTRGNPAGIGVTGDPAQNEASPRFPNGAAAARAQVAHLLVYALGPADAGSLWYRTMGVAVPADDPRYEAYVAAYGNVARATTLSDLAGTWATDPDYAEKVVARGNEIFPNLVEQKGGGVVPNKTQRPVVVVDAGHRSTDRSGNPVEMEMTDDLAIISVQELRRRGYTAFWYQRDLDRDSDPDETIGGLDAVSKGIGAWLRAQPWALFLSLHYNGASSPLHAIVPDNIGLTTAYPEGRDPADTAANNPLDVRLAQEIVSQMARAGLGTVFRGRLGAPGVMSERETGVGGQGYRLAVFAATAPARQTAARLVLEHGGTADPAARRFADFARAAADAIDAVYQEPAKPTYAPRVPVPGAVEDKVVAGRLYLVAAQKRLTAAVEVVPRQAPSTTALPVGPMITKGVRGTYEYIVCGDGGLWRVSKRGTYVPASAFEMAAEPRKE